MIINEFTIRDQDGETITLTLTTAGGFYTYTASNGDKVVDCHEETPEGAAQWALDSYDIPSWEMEVTVYKLS